MKFKLITLALLLPLGLSACQSTDIQKVGDIAVSVLQQNNADKTLTTYEWHLDTGAPRHLELHFLDNGRLSIQTSCNTLASAWSIENNTIRTGKMMGTLMACPEDMMKQEGLAGQIFHDRTVPFILNLNDKENPTLTVTSEKGEKFIFTGEMTPETKYQSQGETIFLDIAPQTKACTGVAPQTCLQVKEVKYNEAGIKTYVDPEWKLFYNQIEGYTHDPKNKVLLRVKRYTIQNPAADQSKYVYIHDMTVESGRAE